VPGDLWTSATQHPFLMAVRDQTITPQAFDRWLVQDALYVADLLTFQARLLARAPRPAQGVLARGCLGIVDELDWFEEQAARRGLSLDQPKLTATNAYAALLTRLDGIAYEAAVTALWALEQVYLDGWTAAVSAPSSPYAAFVGHWTSPAFRAYVDALAALAAPGPHADLVADVLAHEVAFWDMALS
jgi:thiaminase